MYPRRLIIADRSYAHVFFRCHNKSQLFKPKEIKMLLLVLWARYKDKYRIKIFDFIIMDNHAHLIVQAESAEHLGHFMRTVNSQLALAINSYFNRDSQAIRERYKSPVITNARYLVKVIEYIWFNRYKVSRLRPDRDMFCSASWRLNPKMINLITDKAEERDLLRSLLDSYKHLPISVGPVRAFVRKVILEALSSLGTLDSAVYENSHTIGDRLDVGFRAELLSAFRRESIPWMPV